MRFRAIEDNRVEWSNDKGFSCERHKNRTSGGAAALRFPELGFSTGSLDLNNQSIGANHGRAASLLGIEQRRGDAFLEDSVGKGVRQVHARLPSDKQKGS
jgi:hypothetical protein